MIITGQLSGWRFLGLKVTEVQMAIWEKVYADGRGRLNSDEAIKTGV